MSAWTIGAAGHGVYTPSKRRKRPDLCASLRHPGCTYNRALDLTWCLCGAEIYDGDEAVPHISCCGGPLEEVVNGSITDIDESRMSLIGSLADVVQPELFGDAA